MKRKKVEPKKSSKAGRKPGARTRFMRRVEANPRLGTGRKRPSKHALEFDAIKEEVREGFKLGYSAYYMHKLYLDEGLFTSKSTSNFERYARKLKKSMIESGEI